MLFGYVTFPSDEWKSRKSNTSNANSFNSTFDSLSGWLITRHSQGWTEYICENTCTTIHIPTTRIKKKIYSRLYTRQSSRVFCDGVLENEAFKDFRQNTNLLFLSSKEVHFAILALNFLKSLNIFGKAPAKTNAKTNTKAIANELFFLFVPPTVEAQNLTPPHAEASSFLIG